MLVGLMHLSLRVPLLEIRMMLRFLWSFLYPAFYLPFCRLVTVRMPEIDTALTPEPARSRIPCIRARTVKASVQSGSFHLPGDSAVSISGIPAVFEPQSLSSYTRTQCAAFRFFRSLLDFLFVSAYD